MNYYEPIDDPYDAMSTPPFERALHEAGHAIVALHHNCEVSGITINGEQAIAENQRDGTMLGNGSYGGNVGIEFRFHFLQPRREWALIAASIGFGSHAAMKTYYAYKKKPWVKHTDSQFDGDRLAIQSHLAAFLYDPDETFFDEAYGLARDVVHDNIMKVYRLAKEVNRCETLNKTQVLQIWNQP